MDNGQLANSMEFSTELPNIGVETNIRVDLPKILGATQVVSKNEQVAFVEMDTMFKRFDEKFVVKIVPANSAPVKVKFDMSGRYEATACSVCNRDFVGSDDIIQCDRCQFESEMEGNLIID